MDRNGTSITWANSEAGQKLQKRLSEEQTLSGLDGLLAKIDSLEKAVNNLATMVQQGPGMMAMAIDIADETYRNAAAKGVNVEERLANALAIAEKLTSTEMLEKLDHIVKLADQAPGMVAMTMDIMDEGQRKAAADGVHLDERLNNALIIAEKLTSNAMVEKLDKLFALAEQGPGMMAMTMDIVDETYRSTAADGMSIEERMNNALVIAEKLTQPAMVEKVDQLITMSNQAPGLLAMGIDLFDEEMKNALDKGFDLKALGDIASASNRALTAANEEPPEKITGIFSLLKTLNDKDRQRGLGFLMNFLKHLGKNLK